MLSLSRGNPWTIGAVGRYRLAIATPDRRYYKVHQARSLDFRTLFLFLIQRQDEGTYAVTIELCAGNFFPPPLQLIAAFSSDEYQTQRDSFC